MVPRGVTVIAGGTVEPEAREFHLAAEVGSETYGICSNRFLDREFKTVRYELKVTIHDANSFSYEEDTQLQIKGQSELFHHIDKFKTANVPYAGHTPPNLKMFLLEIFGSHKRERKTGGIKNFRRGIRNQARRPPHHSHYGR